jgi:hypothetical protein
MVSNDCSRSQGQPVTGVRREAMMASRVSMERGSIVAGDGVRLSALGDIENSRWEIIECAVCASQHGQCIDVVRNKLAA